jgi:dTDP-4-dehydrorhamnose reductase
MRIAVTGAGGRLGRALVSVLGESPIAGPRGPIAWPRSELDLDRPEGFAELLDRDRPEIVIHAAAWTDVDGCARDPDLAMRRNGVATAALAAACAERAIDIAIVSTNEVFDGRRSDGAGYRADDAPRPINAYGASKLAGERGAEAAYRGGPAHLGIVRTAWLYGPPGYDFPAKILAAASRAAAAGEPLQVVSDEIGSPTYAPDLAEGIIDLIAESFDGIHHLVNAGIASRAAWAREILRLAGMDVTIDEVPSATWQRASTPPLWAVLEPTALPSTEALRPWPEALADYLPVLVR